MPGYSQSQLRALAENGLGAELPPPPKPRKNEEMAMQMAVVSWWSVACSSFNVPEFLLWHTPNGSVYGGSAENRARIGAMMKRQGAREGVPDIFIGVAQKKTDSSAWWLGWHGLFIEMKTPTGVLSAAQKLMIPELQKQGYAVHVCRTVEDAKQVIGNYLK